MNSFTVRLVCTCLPALSAACAPGNTQSVSEHLAAGQASPRQQLPAPTTGPSGADFEILARVNDRPIVAQQFQELLTESHGLFVLEQLIALEMVREYGGVQGVSLSEAEIDAEYDRSLREMARAAGVEAGAADAQTAGREMLDQFLAARNISPVEYRLSVERNAYLRKMVQDEVSITDAEVIAEFERRYGRLAVVRHIVLPDLKTVGEVRTRLQNGEDFAELARAYSVHRLSGTAGGLLPAFTQGDPQIPLLLRNTAFGMQPGSISEALVIDGQYHLIRLEQFDDPRDRTLDAETSDELRAGLRDSRFRVRMDQLERSLFKQAQIRIFNPDLQDRFRKKHAGND